MKFLNIYYLLYFKMAVVEDSWFLLRQLVGKIHFVGINLVRLKTGVKMDATGFARARPGVAYINVREPVDGARNAFWRHFASVLCPGG